MKVAIRADAYPELGTGHVMRCLALAQGIKDGGGEVVFVTYSESEGLRERLRKEGCRIHMLTKPGSLEESLSITDRERPDWVVLDGYHFDTSYQKAVRESGYRLLCIDDNCHLGHYYADIILNQNYGAEKFRYVAGPETQILAGTRYCLLRREFLGYADFRREIPDVARKILVTMGGADPGNHTLKAMKSLELIEGLLDVKVVAGAGNPNAYSIEKEATKSRHNVEIAKSVENMAALMAWADVAVSAGGTTLWELACMGLPSLVCIIASNQESAVNALVHDKVFRTAGWISEKSPAEIAGELSLLLQDRTLRDGMSKRMAEVVDGKGVDRALHEMRGTPYDSEGIARSLRRDISFGNVLFRNFVNLSEEEKEKVRRWRNSDEIRRWMFSEHLVSREEHLKFIEALGVRCADFHWMVFVDGVPVGVVNFQRIDIAERSGHFGIYSIRKGSGGPMLEKLLHLWFDVLHMRILNCELKRDNAAAHKLYRRFGFSDVEAAGDCAPGIISMRLTADVRTANMSKRGGPSADTLSVPDMGSPYN